jgi:hypothetical protein
MSNLESARLNQLEIQAIKNPCNPEANINILKELKDFSSIQNGQVRSFTDKRGGAGFDITNADGTHTEIDFDKASSIYSVGGINVKEAGSHPSVPQKDTCPEVVPSGQRRGVIVPKS